MTTSQQLLEAEFEANIRVESKNLSDLQVQKTELLSKVQGMKKELQEWRTRLDTQVKSYRGELTELRKTLNTEVDSLRNEFLDLKSTLRQQLELTSGMTPGEAVEAERMLQS